jgi:hypothetical protein
MLQLTDCDKLDRPTQLDYSIDGLRTARTEEPRKAVSDTTYKEWQQEREIEIGVGKKELRDKEE